MRRFCHLAVLAALMVAAAAAGSDGARPPILDRVDIDQRLDQTVPLDASFRDETGRAVRLGDYFGDRPVILTLVYYECPMLCTQVLNGLVAALSAVPFTVGKDLTVVTVSFDPGETAALAAAKKERILARYGQPGAEAGWHFLTGDEPTIGRLADAVGFRFAYDPARDQYAHGAAIVLLTPQGRIARYLFGVEYAPRDLRLGLVEASAGRIGSLVDRLLLLCYHYDPATGKYGALVMRLVRVGGVLTVLGLGTLLVLLRRRGPAET